MTSTQSKPGHTFSIKPSPQTTRYARVWGVALALTGFLLFALTTYSLITHSLLYGFDQVSSTWFGGLRSQATPTQVEVLKLIGQLGSDGTVVFLLGLLVLNLVRKNYRHLYLLLVGAVGGEILWLLLIYLFDRPRPQAVTGFGGLDLPSYPSGHAELVVTVFLLLLYMYNRGLPSRAWGLAFSAFVIAWSILTGAVRLFLNVHFFTDVLSGYALGLAWTGITIMFVDLCLARRNKKKSS